MAISWGADEIAINGDFLALLEDAQDLPNLVRVQPLALGPAANVGSGNTPLGAVGLDDLKHHFCRRNGRRAWPSRVDSVLVPRRAGDLHLGQQRLHAIDADAYGVRTPRCAASRVLTTYP